MKTLQVLDKYRKQIEGLLSVAATDRDYHTNPVPVIEFQVSANGYNDWQTIGEIIPEKKYNCDWMLGAYRMLVDGRQAASWKLYQLPHCCAICVSCNALVEPAFRGKRIGTTLNSLRQEIARLLGYSLLLCTDVTKNEHQRKLLKTQGWKDIYEVYNRRTTNNVVISVINV